LNLKVFPSVPKAFVIGSLGQAAVLFTLFFGAAERAFDISNL
jgi:hypothetical protein